MKKQLIILIAFVVVLAGLGAGLFFALRQPAADAASSSASEPIAVLAVKPEEVQAVTLTNANGALSLVRDGETMQVEGLDKALTSQPQIETLLNQCAALTAKQEVPVEPNADRSSFGLSPAVAEAQITLADRDVSLKIGGEAPAGMGLYLEADGKLYLVEPDSVSAFSMGLLDLVPPTPTAFLTQDVTINEINLSNRYTGELPIQVQYKPAPFVSASNEGEKAPEATWEMLAPLRQKLDTSRVESWTRNIFGLAGQRSVAINPTAEELSQYGLDAPQAVLKATTSDGKTTVLTASKAADGLCYVMNANSPVVYLVDEGNIPWLNLTTEMVRGSIFPPTEPAEIRQIVIEGNGESYTLLYGHGAVSINGERVDPETLMPLIQQTLHLRPRHPSAPIEPKLVPAATITIAYTDQTRPADLLELVPTGDGNLYLVRNGVCQYLTGEADIQALLTACRDALPK